MGIVNLEYGNGNSIKTLNSLEKYTIATQAILWEKFSEASF